MEEIIEKLTEKNYWIFWDDEVYNSGMGHWTESQEEIKEILKEGFYDGEGNEVKDFLITDYDLNTIYKQGEGISIYDTVLPNTKKVEGSGYPRFVNLKTKGATDYTREAIVMSVLKDNEYYHSYDSHGSERYDIYCVDENGKRKIDTSDIIERVQQLKEKIISAYSLNVEEKKEESQDNKEKELYSLLREVENIFWEKRTYKKFDPNEEKKSFMEDIKEMTEGDSSIRTSSIQQAVGEIERVLENEGQVEPNKGENR